MKNFGQQMMMAAVVASVLAGAAAVPAGSVSAAQVSAPTDHSQGIAKKHIYPEIADSQADVNAAIAKAKKEHKRVLIDFGGDWCPDCQVLDIYLHQSPNVETLNKYYVLSHVNIGREDANLDLASRYGVDATKGVPAVAVIEPNGKIVYAQTKSSFSDARHMESQSVTDFLNKYKQ